MAVYGLRSSGFIVNFWNEVSIDKNVKVYCGRICTEIVENLVVNALCPRKILGFWSFLHKVFNTTHILAGIHRHSIRGTLTPPQTLGRDLQLQVFLRRAFGLSKILKLVQTYRVMPQLQPLRDFVHNSRALVASNRVA